MITISFQKKFPAQYHSLSKCVFYFLLYILVTSCAQPISPTGGKKDIIAPTLLSSTPTNKQTNYKGRTVDLEFDEYIVAENLQQKLLITPDAGEYDSKIRPTGIRLTFKKSLDTATTYSLSFGDAIKDFSEKNPAKNLRVVFSTGLGIDSAFVSGQVKDLLTDKPLLETLVGLYPNTDTLNIEKMKPSYFTRSDSAGRFSIENIRPNTYRLYAFDDKNRSLTYNSRAERIAYLRDSITIVDSTQISGVSLKLFMTNNNPPKVRNTQPRANYYSINYDKGFLEYSVKFNNPEDSIPHYQAGTNELKFYNTKNRKDTIVAKIVIRDSVGLTFEHTQKIKFREARGGARNADSAKEPFDMRTDFPENGEIEPKNFDLKLTFNKPLTEARLNQIQLFSDSTKAEVIKVSDFKWENNQTILSLSRPIAARRQLKIIIPKSTFFSVENDTIPARNFKLTIMDEEDYGTLEGEVRGAKSKFIIELLNDKQEVVRSISNKNTYSFKYLKPAVYTLRIIIDENGNGKWDTGDVKAKKLAEPIVFHTEAVKVKKNFVVSGIDIDLSTK